MNQSNGIRQDGKWTHTDFPTVPTYNGAKRPNGTKPTFGQGACGPTSCAMAITGLRLRDGKKLDKAIVVPTVFNNRESGFNGIGSNADVGERTAKKYGYIGKLRAFTKEQLKNQLLIGRYVLCWVTHSIYGAMGDQTGGDTRTTGGGHFILIHGYRDGKFAVADPNNMSQSYWVNGRKAKDFSTFNSHLGNGPNNSYTVIWK